MFQDEFLDGLVWMFKCGIAAIGLGFGFGTSWHGFCLFDLIANKFNRR